MKINKLCSLKAASALVLALTLLLWLGASVTVTAASAKTMAAAISQTSMRYLTDVFYSEQLNTVFEDDNGTPGFAEYRAWRALGRCNGTTDYYSLPYASFPFSGGAITVETALAVYDENFDSLWSGRDCVYFPYVTKELWEAGSDVTIGYAKAEFDFASVSPDVRRTLEKYKDRFYYDCRLMRLTGVLDGTDFYPQTIEYVDDGVYSEALESLEPTAHYFDSDGSEVTSWEYTMREIEEKAGFEWGVIIENAAVPEGETVMLYSTRPAIFIAPEEKSFDFKGRTYESLYKLLTGDGGEGWYGLVNSYGVKEMYTNDSAYTADKDGTRCFSIYSGIRAYPLKYTMKLLTKFYILSFLAAAAAAGIVIAVMKNRLFDKLREAEERIPGEWKLKNLDYGTGGAWREPYELNGYIMNVNDRLRAQKNEINRLNTALDYAKDAEQSRRRMVSDIAHELKTPLAVISSYSEGLRERIAEEKRDKYLDVIVDEAQHMDAMILEMLELSRLEAGKVKLSRDTFSISALTRSVFDRLALAIEAKELKLDFDIDEREETTADEARITQVITNLAANAVKYTPCGGFVSVKISAKRGSLRFAMENASEALSEEALSKVWDTFYRASGAREGEGSGLGLAIVKSIVELHGGECFARNTQNGVEFGFYI